MKRITAILTAALIALSVSLPAFAVPEDGTGDDTSSVSQAAEESKAEKKTDKKSDSKSSENSEGSKELKPEDVDSLVFKGYNIKEIGMGIDFPDDMYILTSGLDKDDPVFEACRLTKLDVEKSFEESDTCIRAYAKDFSFDITVQVTEDERTKAIGNLTTLADAEVQNVADRLLENEYTKGCSRNTYNNTLFLTLDTQYNSGDTDIYGIQEYTIVKDANVVITFQSYSGKLTPYMKALVDKIMQSVSFTGIGTAAPAGNVAEANVKDLDQRYIYIMISSIVAVIALAGIIIVAVRYRQGDEEEHIEDMYEEDETDINAVSDPVVGGRLHTADSEASPVSAQQKPAPAQEEEKKGEPDSIYSDSTLFRPVDENVIFTNEKLREDKKRREETRSIPRLDTTTELEIPENPYTPVGKAEAVAQPALSVTSEIAKLSTISEEEKKQALEKKQSSADESTGEAVDTGSDDEGIVFAESAPKPQTEIEQIGEEVFGPKETEAPAAEAEQKDEQPEEELSEYEKRFGRNRFQGAAAVTASASTIVPVDDDEKKISKFERHFGKPVPAAPPVTKEEEIIAVADEWSGEDTPSGKTTAAAEITDKTAAAAPADSAVTTMAEEAAPAATAEAETPAAPAEVVGTAADAQEAPDIKKPTLFGKLAERIFAPDEEDGEPVPEKAPEADARGRESTNRFLRSLREHFEYRASAENEENDEDIPDGKTGAELYRAPGETDHHIELAIKKGEDGQIVIDSINDETGKPVQIEIKEGTQSPAKPAAEEKDSGAYSAPAEENKADADSSAGREKPEDKKPDEAPKADDAEEGPSFDKLFGAGREKPEDKKPDEAPKADDAEEGPSFDKLFGAGREKPEDKKPDEAPKADDAEEGSTFDKLFGAGREKPEDKKPDEAPKADDAEEGSTFDKLFGAGREKPEDKKPDEAQKADDAEEGSTFDKLFGAGKAKGAEGSASTMPKPDVSGVAAAAAGAATAVSGGVIGTAAGAAEAAATVSGAAAAVSAAVAAGEAAAVTAAVQTAAGADKTTEITETEDKTVITTAESEPIKSADEEADGNITEPEAPAEAAACEAAAENITEAPAAETQPDEQYVMPVEATPEEESVFFEGTEADEAAVSEAEQSAEAENTPPARPAFIFERDAGIAFEHAPAQEKIVPGYATPFTNIPRLESVSAEEYNRRFEALRAERDKPQVAIPEPAPAAAPAASVSAYEKKFGGTKSAPAQPGKAQPQQQDKIEFYTGYDPTEDPFAPGSGEIPLSELEARDKPSIGERLKRSFGKLFASGDEE